MGWGLAADGAGAGEAPGYVDGVLAFGRGVFCVRVFWGLGLVVFCKGKGKGRGLQLIRTSSPGLIVRTAWTY